MFVLCLWQHTILFSFNKQFMASLCISHSVKFALFKMRPGGNKNNGLIEEAPPPVLPGMWKSFSPHFFNGYTTFPQILTWNIIIISGGATIGAVELQQSKINIT